MTINEILLLSKTKRIKVNINVHNISIPFNDAIVTNISRDFVTFLIVEYNSFSEHIYEYTFNKKLIIGVGYVKASLELNKKDIDDEEGEDIFLI